MLFKTFTDYIRRHQRLLKYIQDVDNFFSTYFIVKIGTYVAYVITILYLMLLVSTGIQFSRIENNFHRELILHWHFHLQLTFSDPLFLHFFSIILDSCLRTKYINSNIIFVYFTTKMFQYNEIALSLYESPWYLGSNKLRKTFLFVHMAVSKPIKLTAGKILDLNMGSFIGVMCAIKCFRT